ncbi:MAG TPA: hypothetical protein VGL73_09070 [Caulobacteraceae bacterium]
MGQKPIIALLTATLLTALATGARAADICQGPRPAGGVAVHGPVLAVPDGSSLCVATDASPSAWVRIPLSQLQTTRPALMAAAFGKNATCSIDAQGRGSCIIEGQSLAATLHQPEIVDAAVGWR